MSATRVFPREARSILTPTGGYLRGFTHSLQPYAGCSFHCHYCYVRESTVQRTNPWQLDWGDWLAPKTNAPALLAAAARRGKLAGARIFCSSSTDPSVPQERRLGLTRGCLEVMIEHPPEALVLQTRSPFVVRDAARLARIPSALASITVGTLDATVRRLMEPDSPSVAQRLDALRQLRDAGVRTQAAVSPLLPGDARALAERLEPLVDRVVIDDFFRGDGAGGRRSRAALERLRGHGFGAFAEPGYADEAVATFRRVFGAERVFESAAGFADFSWLSAGRVAGSARGRSRRRSARAAGA